MRNDRHLAGRHLAEGGSGVSGATVVCMVVGAVSSSIVVAVVVAVVGANCRTVIALGLGVLRARTVVVAAACRHGWRTRTNGELRVGAEHSDPRTVLGTT